MPVSCVQGRDIGVLLPSLCPNRSGYLVIVVWLRKVFQEAEGKWLSLESGGRVPLLKTAFSMTIKGIT